MLTKNGALRVGFSKPFVRAFPGLFSDRFQVPFLTLQDLTEICSEEASKFEEFPVFPYRFYKSIYKSIPGAPSDPSKFKLYRKEWKKLNNNWKRLFNYGRPIFMSYEELQLLCYRLGIKSKRDYTEYHKKGKLPGAPSDPQRLAQYKDQWVNWYSFWGNERKLYTLHYDDLRWECEKLGFSKPRDYRYNYRRIKGAPYNPAPVYYKKWKGWKHFLGISYNV